MVAIVAAAIVAYHNSFSGPFVLDDHPVIRRQSNDPGLVVSLGAVVAAAS
jgi:hypothetical protein